MSESHSTQFCVYIHRRKDNNAIFYVGKGSYHRAHNKSVRNRHWKFIEAKHGRTVEILQWFDTEQEALDHELFLILSFRVFGLKLANIVDGGGGIKGYRHTERARRSMSQKRKGVPLSEYHYNKLVEAQRQEGVREKRSSSLRRYYSTDEGLAQRKAVAAATNARPETRMAISKSLSATRRATGAVRPVRCITHDTEFECIADAKIWLSKIANRTEEQARLGIQSCVGQPHKSYLGTKWEYIEKKSCA